MPVSLEIPALRVRTSLVQLGLTSTGTLQVPSGADYDRAGWYKYSPTPGSIGPAVIAGHVDSARRGPSVFFGLAGLRNGDVVRVARSDGTVALFAVDTVRRYAKAQFPTQLVYGNTSNAVLRLITCGGTFDRQRGSYRDNIIVTATLVATG